jgi:transposase
MSYPDCGAASTRVHAYHHRHVNDGAVGARPVRLVIRVRRLVCPSDGCRRTFREQIPDVVQRYQRRTVRLAGQIAAVVKELAGRGGSRVLTAMATPISRHTALRVLRRLPVAAVEAPRVLGVDALHQAVSPKVLEMP